MSDFIPQPTPTPIPLPIQNIIYNIFMDNLGLIIGLVVTLVTIGIIYKIIQKRRLKTASKNMMYKDFNVAKYAIIMFRKIGDRYVQMDKKKITIEKNKWRYNNKDFATFNINHIAFADAKSNYYAFDYDTGKQLTFMEKGMPKHVSIDDVDIYVNRGIIEQLVRGLETAKMKSQWAMLIIGLALGIAIGIVIGLYLPKATEQAITKTTQFIGSVLRFVE